MQRQVHINCRQRQNSREADRGRQRQRGGQKESGAEADRDKIAQKIQRQSIRGAGRGSVAERYSWQKAQ